MAKDTFMRPVLVPINFSGVWHMTIDFPDLTVRRPLPPDLSRKSVLRTSGLPVREGDRGHKICPPQHDPESTYSSISLSGLPYSEIMRQIEQLANEDPEFKEWLKKERP